MSSLAEQIAMRHTFVRRFSAFVSVGVQHFSRSDAIKEFEAVSVEYYNCL
jgi:hypothetical protein